MHVFTSMSLRIFHKIDYTSLYLIFVISDSCIVPVFFIYHYYVNVSHNKCLDTHMWKNENRVHTFKAIAIIVVLVAPLCLHDNRGKKVIQNVLREGMRAITTNYSMG